MTGTGIQDHLILGGGGFIGRHVALLLAGAGHRVKIAGRKPPAFRFPKAVAEQIKWEALDLTAVDWDRLVSGVDVIHHYSWSSIPASANANPSGDLLVNVGATLGLLDALKRQGHGRVVFASSGGTVYGKLRSVPVTEDHPLAPITAYGAGKATAELYLMLYRTMHGLDCRVARVANPYGAGQDLSRGLGAVTTFLHHALTGQEIVIWGDGNVVRDYVHISDVASCLVTLACAPRTEADFVINVGSGTGISLNDIVTELEARLGHRLAVVRTATRAFDVPVSILAIDRARRVLNWSPRLSFSEGIMRTLADLEAGHIFSTLDEWVATPCPRSQVTASL
jgi:UDP-glucose 4-epimerase